VHPLALFEPPCVEHELAEPARCGEPSSRRLVRRIPAQPDHASVVEAVEAVREASLGVRIEQAAPSRLDHAAHGLEPRVGLVVQAGNKRAARRVDLRAPDGRAEQVWAEEDEVVLSAVLLEEALQLGRPDAVGEPFELLGVGGVAGEHARVQLLVARAVTAADGKAVHGDAVLFGRAGRKLVHPGEVVHSAGRRDLGAPAVRQRARGQAADEHLRTPDETGAEARNDPEQPHLPGKVGGLLLMVTASSKTSPLASRIATTALRIPPRIFPIPGWFPVVVERFHPSIAGERSSAEVVTHGVRMRLDLRDYIQLRIYYESHEPHQLAFFERFLRKGDVVLDVGAHVGIFTLVSARSVGPAGEVHSFEPVPANYETLSDNVRLNGFDNIVVNRAAVGDEPGEVRLGVPEGAAGLGGATSAMYTVGGTANSVSAPVVTLDDYVSDRLADRSIRLLKLDVEGLEPAVLEGFDRHLSESPPDAVVLEVNLELLERHGFTGKGLLDALRGYGYSFFRSTARGQLRTFEPDVPDAFDPARDVPQQGPGLLGWLRRYQAESRIFFNLFAVQRHVKA
jgi:FkbM family methyltransferase